MYIDDRAEYFRRLDAVVNAARQHGIGLVPSLFWYYACVPDLVGEPMELARKLNKPIFIGEFGAPGETPEAATTCRRLMEAIIDHDIPLAALWVFDYPRQQDFNVTVDNARAWQLELITEANRRLRAKDGNP